MDESNMKMKSLTDSGKGASTCCVVSFSLQYHPLPSLPARLNSHPQSVLLKVRKKRKSSFNWSLRTSSHIALYTLSNFKGSKGAAIILLITPTGVEMKGLAAKGLAICPSHSLPRVLPRASTLALEFSPLFWNFVL